MDPSSNWRETESILCVRLDALGDVQMTSPAIRALKADRPDRKITLLTSPAGAAAAQLISDIDELIVYRAPWMKHEGELTADTADLRVIDEIRGRFDAAIIFTVFSQNPLPAAMLCFWAGIPLRAGYCRENPYRLLTHHFPEIEPERTIRHEAMRQLDLVRALGFEPAEEQIRLDIASGHYKAADQILSSTGIDLGGRRWAAMHIGATARSRIYPHEKYAAATKLLNEAGVTVAFTGSPDDAAAVDRVLLAAGGRNVSLAGKTELPELAAVIDRAPVLITNNTAAAHIAAGTQTPAVVLYALTNPQHAPWRSPHKLLYVDVPCRFCYRSVCPELHHRCLNGVEPAAVAAAALELLDRGDGAVSANMVTERSASLDRGDQ